MATVQPLNPVRRSLRPSVNDTLELIAGREFPGVPTEEAMTNLRAWNPHLMRGRRDGYVLVSDVVFLEPAPKPGEHGGW